MINQDPMDILHDDYCQSLSEAESLPSSESDFDGCNHRCWQRSGFDTMALIIMLHHYLVGTFGLLNLLNLMCWWQFDCWYQFVFGLLIWLWLWLIDYNLMMTWWLDSMITIWLQWFDYNSVTMIWGWQWYLQTWWIYYGYVDEQHADAKVQLSKTYVYRLFLLNQYYFDDFHCRVCVLPLIERMFHYELTH